MAPVPKQTPKPAPSINETADVLEHLSINDTKPATSSTSMSGVFPKPPAPEVKKTVAKAPAKKAPAKKVAPKKAAPKKKVYESSDDDSDDFMSDSDSEIEVIAAPAPSRGRSARAAAKPKSYVIDVSSDEEFDEDSD